VDLSKDTSIVPLGTGPALREDEIDAWHAVRTACAAIGEPDEADEPGEPTADRARTAVLLRDDPAGSRTLRWVALDAQGTAVGTAQLRLLGAEGQRHVARLSARVDPASRRQGIGSALLATARAAAEADGRTSLSVRTSTGTPGPVDAFLEAHGYRQELLLQTMALTVADCDQEALRTTVRAASPGYHLARWQGVAPADLAAAYARARGAFGDMPTHGFDNGASVWDEERVRDRAENAARRGDALLTVAALAEDEHGLESVAGFSEIRLPGGGRHAVQSDTAVVREHRGRGLGLWVKAAMLQWLLGAHPEVVEVLTSCVDSNRHMIAINEQLGFREVGAERHFQLLLA
jgi:GNAT superfamily N-acetyltransferase